MPQSLCPDSHFWIGLSIKILDYLYCSAENILIFWKHSLYSLATSQHLKSFWSKKKNVTQNIKKIKYFLVLKTLDLENKKRLVGPTTQSVLCQK